MDVEMEVKADGSGISEASTAGGPAPHFHHHHHEQPQDPAFGARGPNAWGLLALARQLVQEGKPSLALQAVVTAVKTKGGDNAVLQTLHRARELYRNKLQANTTADELATLFAKCVIAEAEPSGANTLAFDMGGASMIPNIDETSILAESGRNQIVLDAFLDGSSFVCLQCGGLVSNLRKDEHLAYWCCGRV